MVGMRLSSAVLLFSTVLVTAAILGGAVSYGLFIDTQEGTGMIEAADQFNKVRFPDDAVAYDDANRNDMWDIDESTYDVQQLNPCSDTSVHLRFHDSTNKITNQSLDVRSRSISRDKKFNIDQKHNGNDVRFHTTGDIDISDTKIKNVDQVRLVTVGGNVDLSGTTFQDNNKVTVLAENGSVIMNKNAKCIQNGNVTIRDSSGSISC